MVLTSNKVAFDRFISKWDSVGHWHFISLLTSVRFNLPVHDISKAANDCQQQKGKWQARVQTYANTLPA